MMPAGRSSVVFSRRSQKSSQKILALIEANPTITIDEMSRELGLTDRAVKKNLAILKDGGMVRRIGPDKGGRWLVVKRGR